MPRTPNATPSQKVRLTLSAQSLRVLEELARQGIYGRNAGEVASRFVDAALREFVVPPRYAVKGARIVAMEDANGRAKPSSRS